MGYGMPDRRTDKGQQKRPKRAEAPKRLEYRTFGGSDVALMLNKRPFPQNIVKNMSIYYFLGSTSPSTTDFVKYLSM